MGILNNDFFKHSLIRKHILAFGELFNNFTIERNMDDGTKVQTIQVPIEYGPKDSWYVRIQSDPDLDKAIAMQLPRMSFELLTFTYNSTRQLTQTQEYRSVIATDADKFNSVYMPVPYDLQIDLHIVGKSMDETLMIVEQIVPFFTPALQISINVLPELGIKHDVPIQLDAISLVDPYEGQIAENRIIQWTLSFQMKANLYGPRHVKPFIKEGITRLKATSNCEFLALD